MTHLLFSVFSYFIPINPMNCNLVIYFIFIEWGSFWLLLQRCVDGNRKVIGKKKGFGEVYLEMVRSSLFIA